jgi:hypothetical protein
VKELSLCSVAWDESKMSMSVRVSPDPARSRMDDWLFKPILCGVWRGGGDEESFGGEGFEVFSFWSM